MTKKCWLIFLCRSGRLLPGGEPDFHAVSVNVINDYQRGKLPYFVAPPLAEGETPKSVAAEPTVKASFDVKATAAAGEAGADSADDQEGRGGMGDRKRSRKKEEDDEDLAAIEAEEAERLARFEAADIDSDGIDGDHDMDEVKVRSVGGSALASGVGDEEDRRDARSKKRKAPEAWEGVVKEGRERARDVGKRAAVTVVGDNGDGRKTARKSKRRAEDMGDGSEEVEDDGRSSKKKGRGNEGASRSRDPRDNDEKDEEVDDDDGAADSDGEDAMPSIGEGLEWDDLS